MAEIKLYDLPLKLEIFGFDAYIKETLGENGKPTLIYGFREPFPKEAEEYLRNFVHGYGGSEMQKVQVTGNNLENLIEEFNAVLPVWAETERKKLELARSV
jgi:hypothetical protein